MTDTPTPGEYDRLAAQHSDNDPPVTGPLDWREARDYWSDGKLDSVRHTEVTDGDTP